MKWRKNLWISIGQTGVLLIIAGSLLFLYKIPWAWMMSGAPLLTYMDEAAGDEEELLERTYMEHVPLYIYAMRGANESRLLENEFDIEQIRLAEARDEEEQVLSKEKMEEENSIARETKKSGINLPKPAVEPVFNESVQTLDLARYNDFETLLQEFYVVDRGTYITGDELNVEKMLSYDLRLKDKIEGSTSEGPQVLIYHTHSQEAYADSVPGDESMTVVGAGAQLAKLLETYGIRVLHHKGEYDVVDRDYAYANAEKELPQILEENPSIEVIIDLHRDGVADDTRLVTEIDGKPTAQFMFFNGLSRLKSTGEIAYLKNENREGNLAFSFQLQLKCKEYYPNLARSIYLKGYRYNMQYREKSLLVELGAQTNTVEEVYNALPPLAHVISMVLLGETE